MLVWTIGTFAFFFMMWLLTRPRPEVKDTSYTRVRDLKAWESNVSTNWGPSRD